MRIVQTLDGLEDGTLRLGTRAECAPIQQLTFQRGEKALRDSIVEAVTDAGHRRPYTGLFAALSPPMVNVRRTPI